MKRTYSLWFFFNKKKIKSKRTLKIKENIASQKSAQEMALSKIMRILENAKKLHAKMNNILPVLRKDYSADSLVFHCL